MTYPQQDLDQRRAMYKASIGPQLQKLLNRYEQQGVTRKARSVRWVMDQMVNHDNLAPYKSMMRMVRFPVTIEEFADSKEFVGVLDDFRIWPAWKRELRRMNPDVMCGEHPVHEIDLGGASGTGKTTIAHITTAYQIYLFTCFDQPQRLFHMPAMTPIKVPFMSIKPSIARDILYTPFRTLMTSMPYVQKHVPWDRHKEGVLHLTKHNILVEALIAMDTSMQSSAVGTAILDETSFMEVLEQSKRVPGPRGQGGKFDQAEIIYRAAVNRRNRSFGTRGISIGTICVMSNTRYQGDFMDRRLALLDREPRPSVYHKRLMRHEVHPEDVAAMRRRDTVSILVGGQGYSSRVLKDGEREGTDYPAEARVLDVPARYRDQFFDDVDGALREVCGIATGVISPFLSRREMIAAAFARGKRLKQWVDKPDVDLASDGMPRWVPDNMPNDRHVPRFLHIDLSISKDRCGIAVVKVAGMEHIQSEDAGVTERAPHYEIEVAVTIRPSGTHQIDPAEIRDWLMELGTVYGFEIGGVSYDGFQSHESRQRWVRAGVRARVVGVDRTTECYDHLRRALYQGRVDSVESEILETEWHELEYHASKDKVDHPPKGSKDVSDAAASAIFNASQTRKVRGASAYVDDSTGERVRVRSKSKERRDPVRKGGRRGSRVSLKERMQARLRGEPDPWDQVDENRR